MRRAPDYQELLKRGYGHIGRVGFLSPGIVDETLSGQFYRMAPPGVTLVRTSLELKDVTIEEVNGEADRALSVGHGDHYACFAADVTANRPRGAAPG